jgi:hypothetical protein
MVTYHWATVFRTHKLWWSRRCFIFTTRNCQGNAQCHIVGTYRTVCWLWHAHIPQIYPSHSCSCTTAAAIAELIRIYNLLPAQDAAAPLRQRGFCNRQHTTVTCYLWNIGDETHEGISAVLCTFTKSQWWWLGNLGLGLIIFMWNAWTPVPIVDRAGAKVYLPGAWRRSEGCQMDASILSEPNVEFDGLSIEHERAWNTNVRTGITHRVNNDTQLFVQFTAKIGWQLQPASSVATKSICALWAKKHCSEKQWLKSASNRYTTYNDL